MTPPNELPPPVDLSYSNDLQVHLRILHIAKRFVQNILPHKFSNTSSLEMLIHQEQNLHLHTMIQSFREQRDPLLVDQTLITRCNLKYDRGRGLVVAQARIWEGGHQRELIFIPHKSKLLELMLRDLHSRNHHCPTGTLLSIF